MSRATRNGSSRADRGDGNSAEDPFLFDDTLDALTRRTMEADRLLLAIIQTSLSLIGFGFTIDQIFSEAASRTGLSWPNPMARTVGISLLALGVILLSGGMWSRLITTRELAARRAWLVAHNRAPAKWRKRPSPVLIVGGLLLAVALMTLTAVLLRLTGGLRA